MKKVLALLLVLAGFVNAHAQILLETTFASEYEFGLWTVVNSNGDDVTWKFDLGTSPSQVYYSYNETSAADDWLISPAISATKDGVIAVTFTCNGSVYTEKMEVMYGNASTAEAMVNRGTEVTEYLNETKGGSFFIPAKAGETYYLGFHAVSDADKWRLYLCGVTAKFVENSVDLAVSEIVSPAGGENLSEETVTVKIKNEGFANASGFKVGFSVDGVTVAEETVNQEMAAGAEIEYTFAAKADLSTPRKSYKIAAWTYSADDMNTANDTREKVVLHTAPASVPYSMGFEESEYTADIKIFNLNEDSGDWNVYTDQMWSTARTGDYCLAYNYDTSNNGDDWAIFDPIEIKEAGYYMLKFWYSTDDSYAESFSVHYGAEPTVEAMTNQIVDLKKVANSKYKESISIIYVDKPQNLCLGFYSYTDKNNNWIFIDDLSLEKIEADDVDLSMVSISNPGSYVRSESKKDITFTLRSLSIKDITAQVKVMIDDKVISETSETIGAQEVKQFELADKLEGVNTGKHTLKAIVTAEGDKNTANDVAEMEFRVLDTPVVMWDFENGVIPAEFKFKVEDSGTPAESGFDENGWGLFHILDNEQYGSYIFAGTTWLEGTDQADRWCVLPEIKVTSSESFLVWDVASFNEYFLEDYSIMISSNGDDSGSYFTGLAVIAESADFKTRGLDLSGYVNKNIFVAFRLRSKNCEFLTLDNIGLYGGLEFVDATVSINDITGDAPQAIVVEDDCVKANVAVTSMMLIDLSGKAVAQTEKAELSLSNVDSGVYVVKVVTAAEVITKKIIVKK